MTSMALCTVRTDSRVWISQAALSLNIIRGNPCSCKISKVWYRDRDLELIEEGETRRGERSVCIALLASMQVQTQHNQKQRDDVADDGFVGGNF
jgi:hypothetical protein